ncbi:hypothetical protein SKAU_G00400720, partial [Synaphobranchus kaupii]
PPPLARSLSLALSSLPTLHAHAHLHTLTHSLSLSLSLSLAHSLGLTLVRLHSAVAASTLSSDFSFFSPVLYLRFFPLREEKGSLLLAGVTNRHNIVCAGLTAGHQFLRFFFFFSSVNFFFSLKSFPFLAPPSLFSPNRDP